MTDTWLPPGVHPTDPSVPFTPGQPLPTDAVVPLDVAGDKFDTGRRAFAVDNGAALGVFQRCAEFWACGVVMVDANNGGTAIVAGRQRGRTSIKIWVPSILPNGTVPLGVVIAPAEGETQAGLNSAIALGVGDSIVLNTEAPVYAGVLPGNTTGACQFAIEFDPPVPVSVDY